MRIALVEDNDQDRRDIADMCMQYLRNRQIEDAHIVTFYNAEVFMASWRSQRFDLVLLDCYLTNDAEAAEAAEPIGMARTGNAETAATTAMTTAAATEPTSRNGYGNVSTGLDIARAIRSYGDDCPIIFVTSSTDFAVQGYEVSASGYLLKPVDKCAITRAFDRIASLGTDRNSRTIMIGNPPVTVDASQIMLCRSSGHYMDLEFVDFSTQHLRINFTELEARLMPLGDFYRCMRGILVNFEYVRGIDGNQFILEGGLTAPITKTTVREARERYSQFMFRRMRQEN